MIRVIDDGSGMNHDDALLAFERHATSKLRTADDLLSIATLGFRGEALPTIAAISRLLLETRTGEDGEGTRVEFAGGKLAGREAGGRAARDFDQRGRYFLLRAGAAQIPEIRNHRTGAHRFACDALRAGASGNAVRAEDADAGNPELCARGKAFRARVSDFRASGARGTGRDSSRTKRRCAAQSPSRRLNRTSRRRRLRVTGFTSRPEVQRTNRNGIYIFVNRRLVRDRLLLHAIGEAYRNIVPPGVFPVVLLFLDLPYQEVDVNVHPGKNRSALPASAVRSRFHARRAAACAFACAANSRISRRAGCAAAAAPIPLGGTASFANGAGTGDAAPNAASASAGASFAGPPRAEIPVGFSSGAGFAEDLELTGAPDRPLPQRLQFGFERRD